jgi:nucleoredoxin
MKSAEIICLFFSALWCPPCRAFTPVLADFYEEANKNGKKLEIVFVSHDENQHSFKEYFA